MKVFQIGHNLCAFSEFMNQFCIDQGKRCIRWDGSRLMTQMVINMQNGNQLLSHGYEHYDYYGDLENIEQGLVCDMTMIEILDKQYPKSKFILIEQNPSLQKYMEDRIRQNSSFVEWMMNWTHTTTKEEMMETYTEIWKSFVEKVNEYFKNRAEDFLRIGSEEHPMKLFLFLNPIDHVYNHFEYFYRKKYCHRFVNFKNTRCTQQTSGIVEICDIYCPYLPQREDHIRKVLGRFHNVHFFKALIPDDLTQKDYQKLSTTYMVGRMITYCQICNYAREHRDIYHKFTKLSVHLSYLSCLRHSLQHSQKPLTLIFEDDIYFDCTEKEFDDYLVAFLKSPYDVAYLGFCSCKNGEKLIQNAGSNDTFIALPPDQSIRCKHAIVYKTNYIERLIGGLLPLAYNSDIQLNHANIEFGAKVAIVRHPIVFQNRTELGSFNDNNIQSNEFDQGLPLF